MGPFERQSTVKSHDSISGERPEKPSAKTIQVANYLGSTARYQYPRPKRFPENGETFDNRLQLASSRRGYMKENPGQNL
jgi:hypothetical protein